MKNLFVLAMLMFCPAAFASSPYYVGLEGGVAATGYDQSWSKTVKSVIESHPYAARLYAGYAFTPNLSLEAGYAYFDKPIFIDALLKDKQSISIHSGDVSAVVKAPLVCGFGLYAKGGLNYIYRPAFDNHMPTKKLTENLGAGLTYSITDSLKASLGYTAILKQSDLPKSELYMLGVNYSFNF